MTSQELRQKFLDFFIDRGHVQIDTAKLVLEDDPTTLFTSAGMQPLIPYLLGKPHTEGKRLVNSQPCFRADDIAEVGDNRHTTFFEMLGNWSLGDYFKKEQLPWIWEFLTKEIGLNPNKLHITLFEGNDLVPKDTESFEIWKSLGVTGDYIHFYDARKNWWSRSGAPEDMSVGELGGTDSEVFYDFGTPHDSKYGEKCHPNCDCGRFVEICNSVFIQYQKQEDGSLKEMDQKNVDFGGGLERLVAASNDNPDVFEVDLFKNIIDCTEGLIHAASVYGVKGPKENFRAIADHMRAATFLIKDGIEPSNKLQGYVLRRLLRRAAIKIHFLDKFKLKAMNHLSDLVEPVIGSYQSTSYLKDVDVKNLKKIIDEEIQKFEKTLENGLKEIEKIEKIDGKIAFGLFQNFGFPYEVTEELFKQKGQEINKKEFDDEFKKHQEASRS